MTRTPGRACAAFLRACALDVLVRKPGNVSVHSAGHGMDAALFLASAEAAAGPLFEGGARVGPRIEGAVRASWAAAGCNTNLGILLLCAPIALALERSPEAADAATLRAAIVDVLADLDRADAAAAFRAIAQANPGGLGHATQHDVRDEPAIDLRTAMALAAERDSLAAQYRDGYPLVFDTVLPALGPAFDADAEAAGARGPELGTAGTFGPDTGRPLALGAAPNHAPPADTVASVQRAYLALLATVPDSHIARKRGAEPARDLMQQARAWQERALSGVELDADPAFRAWDAALKAAGLNPGTTADLLVAGMMLALLLRAEPPAAGPAR
ncbi:MAG: triphosphoribosyl-dephospho-CoA synthase [Methylibium sp. NZG]|nr:MAG: triphosphoribosyl-dephospho-CoA synthase [Methylibium sp. NZG]